MTKRFISLMLSAAVAASAVPAVLADTADVSTNGAVSVENNYDKVLTYGDTLSDVRYSASSDTGVIEVAEDGSLRAVGVGEASVTIYSGEDEEVVQLDQLTIKVEPRKVTSGEVGVFKKIYDGETAAAFSTAAVSVDNAVDGDDVYVSTEGATAEFAAADIGEGIAVKITGLKLAGADADKYLLESSEYETTADIAEELTAQDIADALTAIHQPKGMKKLNLPVLPEGFEVTVKTTSDKNVIAGDMSVMAHAEDKEVELVLTVENTALATPEPTEAPTEEPTAEPTAAPTEEPTSEPTTDPTEEPTSEPTTDPTEEPTAEPTTEPTTEPTEEPEIEVVDTLVSAGVSDVDFTDEQNEAFADTASITVKVAGVSEAEITVNAENGTATGAGVYPMGESVTLEATADEGYIFAGWKVGGEVISYENPYTFEASRVMDVTADIIEKDSRIVNVTVKSLGKGSVSGEGEFKFGDTVTLTASGGALRYWSVNGEKVSQSNPYVFTATEDVTVTANFYATGGGGSLNNNFTYYTVSFESNGGSIVADMQVARNTVVKAPADPTRSGYKFLGWYTDEELTNKYTFSERLFENLTLYAAWEKTAETEEDVLPFRDVKEGDWYYTAVEYMYNNGIMQGMTDKTFEPNTTLTRAMFVTVLHRAEGAPNSGTRSGFADVESGAWYAKAVAWAVDNDITAGYDENTFAPNDTITREQMATMLYRYAKYRGYDMSGSASIADFSDNADVNDWALAAVKWAVDVDILSGMDDGRLLPQGTATRAQCASVIMRCIENLELMSVEEEE